LFAWTRDFNPNLQKNTTAQVWVRIYGLSQEYWRPKIFFAIVSSIGTPICTDAIAAKPMFDRTFGQYARVLVDMDISQTPRYQVLVERTGYAFFVDLEYENLPEFCTHCNMIGHYVEICKKVQGKVSHEENQSQEDRVRNKKKGEASKHYVQTKDGRLQIGNVNVDSTLKDSTQPILAIRSPTEGLQQVRQVLEPTAPADTSILSPIQHVSPVLEPIASAEANIQSPIQHVLPDIEVDHLDTNATSLKHQNRFSILAETRVNDDRISEGPSLSNLRRIEEPVVNDLVRTENIVEIVEVNEDNDSIHDSDCVEETPPVVNKGNSEDLSLQIFNHGHSQDRIHHDMQFLRESWANIAENEEKEQNLIENIEAVPDSSKFTLVTSKASKKATTTKSLTSKSTYGTRSRPGQKKTLK
jgi:hypothetical protein